MVKFVSADGDGVAAVLFDAVESLVGAVEQLLGTAGSVIEDGGDTYAEINLFFIRHIGDEASDLAGENCSDSFGNLLSGFSGAILQKEAKFVAAIPGGYVTLSDRGPENLRDESDNLVAGSVSEVIVNMFEVIQVDPQASQVAV